MVSQKNKVIASVALFLVGLILMFSLGVVMNARPKYTVSLNVHGGQIGISKITTRGWLNERDIPTVTPPHGSILAGWQYAESHEEGDMLEFPISVEKDITLRAVWYSVDIQFDTEIQTNYFDNIGV